MSAEAQSPSPSRRRASGRWRLPLGLVVLLLALGIGGLVAAEDLMSRVQRLVREGHYDLALGLLDDSEQRGLVLGPDLRWIHARLVSDPDDFDRRAAELGQSLPAGDPRLSLITLERAREHFARGRYQTAYEYLKTIPPEEALQLPDLPLFLAMSAQAVGEVRNARLALLSVGSDSPDYATAQSLLAELSLRESDWEKAKEHARRALRADSQQTGAQDLYVLARAAEELGQEEEAREHRRALFSRFPHSAEATWMRERTAEVAAPVADLSTPVTEVEAPKRRQDFALQFGAFRDRSLALKLATELADKVEDLRIEIESTDELSWYRVVGGHYVTRAQAERARSVLPASIGSSVVLAPGQRGR